MYAHPTHLDFFTNVIHDKGKLGKKLNTNFSSRIRDQTKPVDNLYLSMWCSL